VVGRESASIVDFAERYAQRADHHDEDLDRIRVLARQLGETIANAADADQWTTCIEGVDYGGYTFPLPRRPVLRALHGGRHGTHEASVSLRSGMRDIGSVRLLTLRPQGFDRGELEQARSAAECAGSLLALALERASGAPSMRSPSSQTDRSIAPLELRGRAGLG